MEKKPKTIYNKENLIRGIMEKEELKNNLKKIWIYNIILISVTMFFIIVPFVQENNVYMILWFPATAGAWAIYKTTNIYHELLAKEL